MLSTINNVKKTLVSNHRKKREQFAETIGSPAYPKIVCFEGSLSAFNITETGMYRVLCLGTGETVASYVMLCRLPVVLLHLFNIGMYSNI